VSGAAGAFTSGSGGDQKRLVQEEFTKQAAAFAANPTVSDPERVSRLVRAVAPAPDARVLEVATGPGYVALGFAVACREVVGIDLTAAPLAIAERLRKERGLGNVRFERGDAEHLGFDDGAFDVVVCRLAFHHFGDPDRVLREMARVCRTGGTVAVEDLIVSEHAKRSAYQNHFEHLRDPSHTRAFALSELLARFTAAGLEVEGVQTWDLVQVVERWLANAQTPPERAAEVRRLIAQDAAQDFSGTRPFYRRSPGAGEQELPEGPQGELCFHHRNVIVVGRTLSTR
jgi:ubiquinone/menaquinone biosynthesis C-methylase UbiE